MYVDDPTATYRGYRRQALYALFRLFDNTLPNNAVIQPEGNEDLAIYDYSGTLIEIVQVKDHTANLAVSSFKPSFYQRIASYCSPTSPVVVRIASYGPIGPDLQKAVEGNSAATHRVLQTITKKQKKEYKQADGGKKTNTILGLPESEARNIINRLTLTEVDETILTDTVVDALGKTSTGVDAKHAFEFLMWWLITSSETQLKIDRTLAIEKINRIGKFVAQRASYHDEWHTSIIPIGPSEDSPVERDALADEFFRGGRVRFDHINADIDIPRDRFLKEIHSAFGGNNVVVMHSASGQGKTSLAYRYAKEFAPAEFRFEVSPAEDLRHARLLALALMGHVEAIEVPTLVYVDVKPGDDYWVEIVQQLSSVAGIRVLVTIREEDWSRTRTTGAEFSFAEVILSFDQDEARLIYDCLTADDSDAQHLDFDDAWQQFGEKKALFEFVYYLTQAESLADRIAAQITFLQDAVIRGERSKGELELLRLVAVASAYEARVDLVSLVDCCDLVAPERTLERFNNEYLIRVSDDGRYVEGFHSIRSTIITQELTDPVLHPWTNVVCRCLPLIVEDDLENFLLCAFSRHVDSAAELLAFLDNFHPRSWVGIRGVVTSVMWNSLSVYTEQNASILEEVFDKTHDAWYLTLDWDLAQVYGKGGFQVLENWKHISPEYAKAAEYAQSAREQQTDKDAIFLDLRRWLKRFSEAPSTPTNIGNFAAMAEVLFWVGHLDIQTPLRDSFTDHVLDQATDELPIHLLGEFILGIRIGRPDLYDQWHSEHSEHLTTRIRQEAAILALVEDDEAIVAHYIIDTDQETSRLRQRNNFSNSTNTLHESTLERIELLSQVFAGKKRYGAIGYGHRTSIVRQIVDEAEKPGVMAEYLHPPWAPRFNALARGLVEHRFRPDSWTEYFSILQTRRQDLLSALDDLRRAITAFNPTRKPSNKFGLQRPAQWDECRNSLGRPFLLPKVAVDEWGFTTESTEQNRTDDIHRLRYPALNRLSPIRDAVNEYTRTVGNFMSQALDGLVLLPNLHMADDPSIKANVLAKAAEFGIDEQSVRLSIVNGVDACAAVSQLHTATYDVFGSLGLPNTSGAMSSRELQVFLSTVTSWCTFTYGGSATRKQQVAKKAHLRKPKKNNRQKSVSTQPGSFSDLLNPTRNRLRSALQGLKRDGIEASILSETIPWNGKSALWISCNTEHPLASLAAIEKIWHRLVAAFGPDRDKIVRVKAIDLLWSEIILVPLVSGKSLEGHALPHFRGVANVQEPDLEQNPWYFFPEIIPEDAWDQLRLKRWEANSSWSTFDQFTTAYGMLCQHVDHLADFKRLRAKLDELGISILQSHIDNEMLRIQPLSQEVLDSCSKILNIFNETDLSVAAQRDNLIDCRQILVEIKDYLLPMQDFYQQADLSLGQLADWSNRLRVGLQILGVARSLWIADTLHFSEYNSVNELGLIHG